MTPGATRGMENQKALYVLLLGYIFPTSQLLPYFPTTELPYLYLYFLPDFRSFGLPD